jgi:hypothetical protein
MCLHIRYHQTYYKIEPPPAGQVSAGAPSFGEWWVVVVEVSALWSPGSGGLHPGLYS